MSQPVIVPVPLPGREYNIHIGEGLLSQAGSLIAEAVKGRQVLVVWDENTRPHRAILEDALTGAFKVLEHRLPAGEGTKNSAELVRIWDRLCEARYTRDCVVVALGGGVAGDLVGFAAASYMRGVDFIQIPTTLLAMVDSSVGGKTGINHPVAKNLIGAFWQPRLVLADTGTLKTLEEGERCSALAEIIKYGVIFDAEFFTWLEERIDKVRALEPEALSYAIQRSCEIKAHVVLHDEREGGLRKILNFGHTIGHAIENSAGYGTLRHGEAISIGMVAESSLSLKMKLGEWTEADHARLIALLEQAGLPTAIPAGVELPVATLVDAAKADKKNRGNEIRYALPTRMGEVKDIAAAVSLAEEVFLEVGAKR